MTKTQHPIDAKCKALGISRRELCRQTGISYRTVESLFRTFGEVEAPTAMDIHRHETGNDRHSFRIHHLGANHR